MNKSLCFDKAVEITKEFAGSGTTHRDVHLVLQEVYEMLKKLSADVYAE